MNPWGRADGADYAALGLRAGALLRDVPLHDVWWVDLPGGGEGRTLMDVRPCMDLEALMRSNTAVRGLFRLRRQLGRLFGWDGEATPPATEAPAESYLHRLSDEDRRASLLPPGSIDGGFTVLYVHADEALGEIRNATVHAFSVQALVPRADGYRLFWAIHVAAVGRFTAAYMAMIDPFRRHLIYPAILRSIHRAWRSAHLPAA